MQAQEKVAEQPYFTLANSRNHKIKDQVIANITGRKANNYMASKNNGGISAKNDNSRPTTAKPGNNRPPTRKTVNVQSPKNTYVEKDNSKTLGETNLFLQNNKKYYTIQEKNYHVIQKKLPTDISINYINGEKAQLTAKNLTNKASDMKNTYINKTSEMKNTYIKLNIKGNEANLSTLRTANTKIVTD